MKIVADENIPLLAEFFSDMCEGDLITLPGRNMSAADVKDADILLVRSITQVNETLLKGSKVMFVGTCTIGTDHLDIPYLIEQGIRFHNAPGCNAEAVVEYVLSSLITLGERRQIPWQSLTVGIVGAGNVGGRLYKTLKALNVNVCAYDPNVAEFCHEHNKDAVWLQDVVSLHVPIVQEGAHKTHHLLDVKRLKRMKPNACLINSCRGAVIDNQALLKHTNKNPDFLAILDVWEHEPSPSDALIKACFLATPHIAGYSLDGKYLGTQMIYAALCGFLDLPLKNTLAQLAPEAALKEMHFSHDADVHFTLRKTIRCAYDVRDDHFRMLSLLGLNDELKAEAFDVLRKKYPLRRDLNNLMVNASDGLKVDSLKALGTK